MYSCVVLPGAVERCVDALAAQNKSKAPEVSVVRAVIEVLGTLAMTAAAARRCARDDVIEASTTAVYKAFTNEKTPVC